MSNPKAIAIQNYLPHRKPMLMVDIILEITNDFVSTSFVVTSDNLFVSNGKLQEVALIENAAQTCSAIVGQSFFFDENHKEIENITVLGFISSMKKVTIHRLPLVGEKLITKGTLVSKIVGDETVICVIEVETTVGSEHLLQAEINLFLQKQ
ncbi:MAG: ABC transporter permease [Flavobacteriaceae bacterium]|jgi:predicted hotdog family 3-hydroxylacyl-ACP dehydratase|nr:ABC transporter permease [Flavobacteriaceae bacterium]